MATKPPALMDAFAQLIAMPSVSSVDPALDMSNRPIADLLANWLADLGFSVELLPVAATPEKVNLVARLGEGEGGLVLSGHMDTVPFDAKLWHSDPFQLTEKDGRLYGLGASDMKCFFPIVLEAVRDLRVDQLQRPLTILATADEESNMVGARVLAASGMQLGAYALIGEPTGLTPVRLHKGVMLAIIRLIGRSGHASDPALGRSALEGMHKVMATLIDWRAELQAQYRDESFRVPVPTLNLGFIQGGDNPNRICGECELGIDLRPLPGMSVDVLGTELRERVRAAVAGNGLTVEFDEPFHGIDALQTDPGSVIVKLAEELSGRQTASVAFGTEGPYLNALGMETVVLGPGDIDVAHQANEYLPLDRIEPMQRLVAGMIRRISMSA